MTVVSPVWDTIQGEEPQSREARRRKGHSTGKVAGLITSAKPKTEIEKFFSVIRTDRRRRTLISRWSTCSALLGT